MKSLSVIGIGAVFFMMSGCSHQMKHGTVAMKESDTKAHVSLHDVSNGDSVLLYRNVCTGGGGRDGGKTCVREQLARGRVARVMSEHYSEVEFPSGTTFKEGDFVETAP